jgi:hypothetical protein
VLLAGFESGGRTRATSASTASSFGRADHQQRAPHDGVPRRPARRSERRVPRRPPFAGNRAVETEADVLAFYLQDQISIGRMSS